MLTHQSQTMANRYIIEGEAIVKRTAKEAGRGRHVMIPKDWGEVEVLVVKQGKVEEVLATEVG